MSFVLQFSRLCAARRIAALFQNVNHNARVYMFPLFVLQVEPEKILLSEDHKMLELSFISTVPIICPEPKSNCSVQIPVYLIVDGKFLSDRLRYMYDSFLKWQ